VLRKALDENRVPVILGATRALGELGEGKAVQPGTERVPVLVRALNYPDRRVQFAAADAILRMPRSTPVATSRVTEVLRRAASLEAAPKVLVADPNGDRANLVGQAIQKAGYQVVIANTGNTTLQRLATAADIDAILLDAAVNDPQLAYLIPQIRSDIDAGRLPIIVTGPLQQIAELERRFGGIPGLTVTAETTNPGTLKALLDRSIKAQEGMPLTEGERKDYAAQATLWLARMARGEVPGYDARPAQSALLQGLLSNDLAPLAVEAVGYLPGAEAQRQLARVVLDNTRPVPLRTAAAHSLIHSLQHFGSHLTADQIGGLQSLYAAAPDAKLRSRLAVIAGVLHPDARQTGMRLQGYVPNFTPPAAGKPPAPAEPKKDNSSADSDKN
jgi:CheY-like chemotaxis protein